MAFVPTTPVVPSAPNYGGLTPGTGAQLGGAVLSAGANTLLAGYQAYELFRKKQRGIDYVTGGAGILGTVFAATPIVGPFLQVAGIALGATVALNDYTLAKRKANRLKRAIRKANIRAEDEVARGHSADVASFLALQQLGPSQLKELGVLNEYYANPLHYRHAYESLIGPHTRHATTSYTDPETGQLITEADLLSKYGSGGVGQRIMADLYTRNAPGREFVPAVFAQLRK